MASTSSTACKDATSTSVKPVSDAFTCESCYIISLIATCPSNDGQSTDKASFKDLTQKPLTSLSTKMKDQRPLVDLTTEPKDHLTSLPPELIHLICDYLFPEHYPDIAFHPNHNNYHSNKPHILEKLAATCHTLHSAINTWALHFLRQHSQITKYRDLASPHKQEIRNFLRAPTNHHLSNSTGKPDKTSNRRPPLSLLPWKETHCIFCGKPSQRHAILVSSFRCCSACDKREWPEKITKTRAKTEYYLTDQHLFPPESSPSLTSYPPARGGDPSTRKAGIKGKVERLRMDGNRARPIRYGSYITSNVATTMFLERDVRRLAEEVHGVGAGGWEGYKVRRTAAAEERWRKWVAGRGGRSGRDGGMRLGEGEERGGSREDAIEIS